jgi:hypothetical protein
MECNSEWETGDVVAALPLVVFGEIPTVDLLFAMLALFPALQVRLYTFRSSTRADAA